jgi:hypothetical protein
MGAPPNIPITKISVNATMSGRPLKRQKLLGPLSARGRSLARDHGDFRKANEQIMLEELAEYHAKQRKK